MVFLYGADEWITALGGLEAIVYAAAQRALSNASAVYVRLAIR